MPITCYAIADGIGGVSADSDLVPDTFLRLDDVQGAISVQIIGEVGGLGTFSAEALAIRPDHPTPIWGWDPAFGLITIDPATGLVVRVAAVNPGFNLAFRQAVAFGGLIDVAGLTWAQTVDGDLDNDELWAISSNGEVAGVAATGVLLEAPLNPTTVDLHFAADIAWDPETGEFHALLTDTSDNAGVRRIGSRLGAWGTEPDTEGLAFDRNGTMWSTTGDDGDDSLYRIDKATVFEHFVLDLAAATGRADVEAIDCMDLSPGLVSGSTGGTEEE